MMKFLVLESMDPHYNLAVEEWLFTHETEDVFMLWRNEPTVVIGKNQNVFAEMDLDYVKEKGIHIARRITGGGAVYHDLGNVNYTFIASSKSNTLDFACFTAPIIQALESLGIAATLSGRNDLLVGEKKFSGNAQHHANGRVLHHGTLLFDSDLSVLDRVLRVDADKLKSKAIASARSRVTNLRPLLGQDCDTKTFIERIAEFVRTMYEPTEITTPTDEGIEALFHRNQSLAWIFPEREMVSSYERVLKKRYVFGSVEVRINMSNEKIRTISIGGDFFHQKQMTELENRLSGISLTEVADVLSTVNVEAYIVGMNGQDLTNLILERNE